MRFGNTSYAEDVIVESSRSATFVGRAVTIEFQILEVTFNSRHQTASDA